MNQPQTLRLYRSRWWLLYLPLIVVVLCLLHLALTQWLPLPPRQLVLSVSSSHSEDLARRYERELALRGVQVKTVRASTDAESLAWLAAGKADIALAATPAVVNGSASHWIHVGAVERLPVWIFTKSGPGRGTDALKGSATAWINFDANDAWLWPELRQQAQLSASEASAVAVSEREGTLALLDGRLDALIMVAHAQHPAVARLNREPSIHVVGARLHRSAQTQRSVMHAIALPQGALDVRNNLPAQDTSMLAIHTHLLAATLLPAATLELLWDSAGAIHESAEFLTRQGEFPAEMDHGGASFQRTDQRLAQMLLPYWWAQLTELVLFAVLPILLCAAFLFSGFPRLFERRFDSSIQLFYGELAFLQADIGSEATGIPNAITRMLEKLDDIERRVMQLQLPDSQVHRWYTLRQHIDITRKQILALRAR